MASLATDLFYETYGDEKHPAVVYLHGGPGANAWAFENSSAEKLAVEENYFVVAYDQRGSGRSRNSFNPAHCTLSKFTEDLNELIKSLRLQSPILVGFSFGGFLSLNYLKQYQGVAKGLVMACSPINFPESFYTILTRLGESYSKFRIETWIEDTAANIPPADRCDWWRNALLAEDAERLKKRMFPNDLTPPFNFDGEDIRSLWELVRAAGLLYSPSGILLTNLEFLFLMNDLRLKPGFFRWFSDSNNDVPDNFHRNEPRMLINSHIDLLEEVSSRVPVHAIYSEQDRLFSARQMDKIKETLSQNRQNRFSYIDGAGHFTFLEHNQEFLDVLSDHLAAF